MKESYQFDGRVVLVTGAGRGLGRAYAARLAQLGATVAVNDIDVECAQDTALDIGALRCPGDVSTEAGATAVVARAVEACGRIDGLVANAGTSWHRSFNELTAAEFDDALRHNLLSTVHAVRAVWPYFVERMYGRVVTTASGGIFGIEGRAHYVAAKGGVLALTRSLAIEGRPHGILVNCVLPWGRTRLARPGSPAPPPEEAAAAVAWLCHTDCDITGEAFTIGGGKVGRVRLDVEGTVAADPSSVAAQAGALRALVERDRGLGRERAAQRNLGDEREDDGRDHQHGDDDPH